MSATTTCAGCIHATRRLKYSKPRRYCQRYRQLRDERCIDYRGKTGAITAALNYLRITSSK
ncbi:MAG: hypothetical protein KJ787_14020 [Gammaproteobacteria bacterium]|nr:hypothetical protein [Gammaproteobacteria bacterium]MBU1647444.1 hypothetical protein [Gammaproteobacteria bacterium]MBU1973236.1 hypothetical protein [Gammaproteobacteria bacterium]